MACLYCGKEIGPFRLLRDSEFCSVAHRERYHDRLGRALGRLGTDESTPPGIAGFRIQFPLQEGTCTSILESFYMGGANPSPRAAESLRISPAAPISGPVNALPLPRLHGAVPQPARLNSPSLSVCYPRLVGHAPAALLSVLPECPDPMRLEDPGISPDGPISGPVVDLPLPVLAGAVPQPASLDSLSVPLQFPRLVQPSAATLLSGPLASLSLPLRPGTVPQPARSNNLPVPIRFPRLVPPSAPALLSVLPFCPDPVHLDDPEPAECFICPTISGVVEPALKVPGIASTSVSGVYISPIGGIVPLAGPEPAVVDVFALLDARPAVRSAGPALLRFALHPVEEIAARPKPAPLHSTQPAPACASPAPVPVESMPVVPGFVADKLDPDLPAVLPESLAEGLVAASPRLVPMVASFVPGLRPVAVESLPAIPPAVPVPLPRQLPVRCPALANFQPAQESGDALAAPAAAPGPDAVETFPSAPAIVSLPVAPPLLLIRRPLQTSAPLQAAAGLSRADFRILSAPPSQPVLPGKPAVVPISRMSAQPAGSQPERPRPAIPHPGLFALEYYCQRSTASAPSADLSWMESAVAIRKQPFDVRPALKSFRAYRAKSRKLPPIEEIFAGQTRDGEPIRFGFAAAGKIAATIMVGLALWTGSQIAHFSQLRLQMASSERNVTAAAEVRGSAYGSGPVARFRHAIANRAATEITDTFASGMEAWGAASKTWAPGWQHSPDGYVRIGEIALFHPSLHYTDYHMEFYGQIEQKSMGWIVRGRDKKNYYAMKFTVIEPGLRPIIAVQHYQVTNGKRGRIFQTPLNVMVHNREAYHVAVDVRGNHFAAAIEGESVDSWTDDAIAQGGVGFFSDPGERARLYWMKVSRNQDWLGRICAYLTGDSPNGARQTAALQLPGVPQFWALTIVPLGPTK